MSIRALLQAIPSTVAALGTNAIPAGAVLVGGIPAETAMLMYFFENILLILFTAARVRLMAPAQDEAYTRKAPDRVRIKVKGRIVSRKEIPRNRRTLLSGYLVFAASFSIGTGVFLFLFLFVIRKASVSSSVLVSGTAGIAAFQFVSFVADYLMHGPMSATEAEMILDHSMGRVALLYVAVAAGVLPAAVVEGWFVLPFALLKTTVDLGVPIHSLRSRKQVSGGTT